MRLTLFILPLLLACSPLRAQQGVSIALAFPYPTDLSRPLRISVAEQFGISIPQSWSSSTLPAKVTSSTNDEKLGTTTHVFDVPLSGDDATTLVDTTGRDQARVQILAIRVPAFTRAEFFKLSASDLEKLALAFLGDMKNAVSCVFTKEVIGGLPALVSSGISRDGRHIDAITLYTGDNQQFLVVLAYKERDAIVQTIRESITPLPPKVAGL
jgi:hypothetical protein